ncbi:GNAT family N-acetyltransferase [Aeromicrobium massiliense]|uniref:GNAT family N-acetyltransferase n=1 Tax=Aeromicrobium massiliense TaxID=1464554 RepID=UPI0002E8FF09|nr:GNAT family N-acetyltransferase [Aeromicrobium massiliense]
MSTSIEHDETGQRYVIHVDGEQAGFTQARVEGDVVVMDHTVVDDAFSGQGMAAELVGAALQDVRASGRRVRPTCSYVRHYLDEHPELADLVEPAGEPSA